MKKKLVLSMALATMLGEVSFGQLKIDSDFRTRSELRHG